MDALARIRGTIDEAYSLFNFSTSWYSRSRLACSFVLTCGAMEDRSLLLIVYEAKNDKVKGEMNAASNYIKRLDGIRYVDRRKENKRWPAVRND